MGRGLKEKIEELERRMILDALRRADGIQTGAARELGISERMLRYKLKKYGIEIRTKTSVRHKIVEPPIRVKRPKIQ